MKHRPSLKGVITFILPSPTKFFFFEWQLEGVLIQMPNFDTIEDVRTLSQTQINRLTNAQLKEALGTALEAHTN